MRRPGNALSYSNVMATMAVFIALGGGAYAATQLSANSVGTKQIKKNAVTSSKVKDRSLLRQDFKVGQIPAGAQGARGDTGPQGPKGDTGPPFGTLMPKVTATGSSNVTLSPSDFTFTPAANKAEIVLVNVDWAPPAGTCGGLGAQVTIRLDHTQVALQQAAKGGPALTLTGTASIVSSATPASHTVFVDIADDCPGSETASATATVERIEFG